MTVINLRCVLDARALLGESPLWDDNGQLLYWADIKRRQVHAFDPGSGDDRAWQLDQDVGSLAVRAGGGLVLALSAGFYILDLDSGETAPLAPVEADIPGNRFNDGKPDRQGRFWAGSMDDREVEPSGALYRLDPDHSCHRLLTDITVPNALCWSPDGKTLYHGDSPTQTVWAWDFDPQAGAIANRREFIRLDHGYPDGATVDAEGGLWLAVWGGWRLERYLPDGRLDRRIELPVQCPTCPAFGGAGLQTLYLTSASNKIDDPHRQPQAGGLFALEPGVAGIAEKTYTG